MLSAPWLDGPPAGPILARLEAAGFPAFAVGGAVRDALIGREVGDIDIATAAPPDEVTALFAPDHKVVPTGIAHGTVTVVAEGRGVEVTSFRADIETDGRRAKVRFGTSMAADAGRRDFTMNALYADRRGGLHDPTGQGLDDLRARRVRFVGDAGRRIAEDHLRALRLFRFHAHYGDPARGIDADALDAVARNLDGIAGLATERVTAEMLRLLAAPDPAPAVAAMAATGLLARVLPGASAPMLARLVAEEAGAPPDPIRRLAALGGGGALRLSRDEARRLALLEGLTGDAAGLGEIAWRYGAEVARDVLRLRAAAGMPPPPDAEARIARGAAAVFPVAAADLMPRLTGAALGRRLAELEARWIASDFALGRDELLREA